ncbi:MAG: hypothetical protein IPJ67_03295 [Candidatus Moraniibacteriota bacterium]|nr:MAG: hypothetical protein IPJ67_03295 [Candidatus Moranbacteria bacterium]
MSNIPRLSFSILPEKDISTFFSFVEEAGFDGGRNLEWAVFKNHLNLKKFFRDHEFIGKKSDIASYVSEIYNRDRDVMKDRLKQYEEKWRVAEPVYFAGVHALFDSSFWPEGKYIAFPTVWGMYPRFLEDKTFQLPYEPANRADILFIIAHEMLHFIFYEYFLAKHQEYRNEDSDFFLWHVSEIFNTIVQNSASWPQEMNNREAGYPEHENIVKELSKKYGSISKENLDAFILDIVQSVKKQPGF